MKRIVFVLGSVVVAGCIKELTKGQDPQDWQGTRPGEPGDKVVLPYTGSNPTTLDAQTRFYTGNDLHTKVIQRSCSGTGGVCHNQKEYPDMHTAESFLAMSGAPCNINSKFYGAIFDRCERVGDTFVFGSGSSAKSSEVAYIDLIPGEFPDGEVPTETSPGLHVVLRDAVTDDTDAIYREGIFTRRLINNGTVETTEFARHTTTWHPISPTHLVGVVYEYQTEAVSDLVNAGIRQGDSNRNNTFGADNLNTISMLNPGRASESYLLGRLIGSMQSQTVPGTRMPLANLPPTMPEMLALACFVEGLPADGSRSSMSWAIDYANCSFNENPEALALTGTGVTWSGRILPLLQANCGGCHGGASPSAGLDVLAANVYSQMLAPSSQKPTLQLVRPGNPGASYLWLKLIDDASISGGGMPQDPQTGFRSLAPEELADIEMWIAAGAVED